MSELCHHAWVGDDECAYCKSEELEGLLSECMTRIAELEAERDELRGLLGVAGCPNCDGSGSIAHQVGDSDWEQEQCQWCYEKHLALEEIDNGR